MQDVNFLKNLSDETRLSIVLLIAQKQELCVCDLTEKLQLSQPKISRHLALLRASEVLLDRREGQWVYYSLHPQLPSWCYDIINTLFDARKDDLLFADTNQLSSRCEASDE